MSSRDRLIQAAVELIEEFHAGPADPREVFGYLTPGAVAERAGVSRPLIYHHWSDDDSFRSFLAEVADRIWSDSIVPEQLTLQSDLLPANLSELILGMTALELHRAMAARRGNWRASQALSLYGLVSESGVEEPIVARGEFYRHLGDRLGFEPVEPLTFEQVGIAVGATIEGFTLVSGVLGDALTAEFEWTPKVPTEDPCQRWNLVAVAVEGLLANMVRPKTKLAREGGLSRNRPSRT